MMVIVMADPATITLTVKAAVVAAADRRAWKVLGVLIAAILTPLILAIVMIVSLLSATADHNNAAIDLCFNGGAISSQMPEDYAAYIRDMQDSFAGLDTAISDISSLVEDGSIDSTRVKAIFILCSSALKICRWIAQTTVPLLTALSVMKPAPEPWTMAMAQPRRKNTP